jgi:hypothetical protein
MYLGGVSRLVRLACANIQLSPIRSFSSRWYAMAIIVKLSKSGGLMKSYYVNTACTLAKGGSNSLSRVWYFQTIVNEH